MKTFLLIIAMLGQSCITLHASSCITKTSGDWEDASIWVCGHVPVCGDSIKILMGHTITMMTQQDYFTSCSSSMYINVLGTLIIKTGKKLMLPIGSVVEIQVGGALEPGGGGGSSNLLDIGGINVWKADDGKIPGYAIFFIPPLPIELLKFEAHVQGNAVEILWTTASESNNNFFTVEKSRDAVNFESVSSVDAAGNSTSPLNYTTKDHQPYDGLGYYRLSQTDFDGTTTHSGLVTATYNRKADFSFKIYPNPNDGVCISLEMIADKGQKTLLVLTDMKGRTIYSKEIITNSNEENEYSFCSQEKLAPGIYLVKVSSSQKEYTRKVVVE